MKSALEIAGVHSRTPERLFPVAELWNVPAFDRFEEISFDHIDVVAISVPTAQNASVLQRLLPHASRVSIVIDTPTIWARREISSTFPLLSKFKRVLITEDYMNFPSFALLRRAVHGGLIGKLRGTTLYNIGFMYHGLALIRSFAGFTPARRTWSKNVGSFSKIDGYCFHDGYQAIVVGPYRRHTTGGITIEGSTGILTDFPGDEGFGAAGGRPVYSLATHRGLDGFISGFSIEGADGRYAIDLPDILSMAAMQFPDKSDLNLLRGCGLIEVFKALFEPGNINNAYGPENAFYDSFVPRLASKGVLPVDPFVWFGSDVGRMLRMFAKS